MQKCFLDISVILFCLCNAVFTALHKIQLYGGIISFVFDSHRHPLS